MEWERSSIRCIRIKKQRFFENSSERNQRHRRENKEHLRRIDCGSSPNGRDVPAPRRPISRGVGHRHHGSKSLRARERLPMVGAGAGFRRYAVPHDTAFRSRRRSGRGGFARHKQSLHCLHQSHRLRCGWQRGCDLQYSQRQSCGRGARRRMGRAHPRSSERTSLFGVRVCADAALRRSPDIYLWGRSSLGAEPESGRRHRNRIRTRNRNLPPC